MDQISVPAWLGLSGTRRNFTGGTKCHLILNPSYWHPYSFGVQVPIIESLANRIACFHWTNSLLGSKYFRIMTIYYVWYRGHFFVVNSSSHPIVLIFHSSCKNSTIFMQSSCCTIVRICFLLCCSAMIPIEIETVLISTFSCMLIGI